MDKKKLIGTIIGVVAFIALVAGATYAWLNAAVNVTNGNSVGKTMNFMVNYVNGTAITAMPPTLANANGTSSTTKLSVTASKATGSAPGTMTIYLNTTTAAWNTLLGNGVLNYGYCTSTSATTCSSFTGTGSVTFTQAGYQTGTGAVNRTAIVSNVAIPNSATNYNIYFWLDGSKNDGSYTGQTYSGYIEAVATQNNA